MIIYTPKEVADLFKLSPKSGHKTIQKLAREKKINGFRVGDLWRFTEDDVKAYRLLNKSREAL